MASSYHREVNARALGDQLSYGLIPESEFLRKFESTPYEEDPDQIDNHIRGLLIDFRPDDPYLASDEIRHSWDPNVMPASKEVLNMREFGARSGDEPYLPDGTFLDHEFMARDPRGVATDPDMRKHLEQQYARAAFVRLYNDDDHSVPEQGINPVRMVENIKSGMYQFKDRYKNFEESMDSWHNGGIHQSGRPWGVTTDNFTQDGTIKDLADAPQGNRRDAVAQLSGDPTIGFRYVVPDHRFAIAHYGLVRVSQDKNYNNWHDNRSSTFVDHANMSVINGELVNRQLAYLIADLQGQRIKKQAVAQGAQFNDSAVNQVAKKKLDPVDIYKIQEIQGLFSGAKSANEAFDGKRIAQYGNKPLPNQRQASQNVLVNHSIIDSMKQATKQLKRNDPKLVNKHRDLIEQSTADEGIYITAKTKRPTHIKKTSNQTRNALDNRHIEEQRITTNYKGIKPISRTKVKKNFNGEDFAKDSDNSINRRGKREQFDVINQPGDFEYEQDLGRLDFGVYDKANKAEAKEHIGRLLHYAVDNTGIEDSEQVREIDAHEFHLV